MFIALPLFLAVGFVLGAEWRTRYVVNLCGVWGRLIAFGVGLAFLTYFFHPLLVEISPRGFMIGVGGLAVGAIAGNWFTGHSVENKDRDQLIFLGAAGLFVFFAA